MHSTIFGYSLVNVVFLKIISIQDLASIFLFRIKNGGYSCSKLVIGCNNHPSLYCLLQESDKEEDMLIRLFIFFKASR